MESQIDGSSDATGAPGVLLTGDGDLVRVRTKSHSTISVHGSMEDRLAARGIRHKRSRDP